MNLSFKARYINLLKKMYFWIFRFHPYMKKLLILFIALSFFSCEKINSVTSAWFLEKTSNEDLIDFSQVDQFPQFKNCDALLNHQKGKICFENTLHQKINDRVQNLKLKSTYIISDTLLIHFTIDKEGCFKCNKIKVSDTLQLYFPDLTKKVQEIIHELDPVNPAQKRGIPVTSTYMIPILIQTK
ncbi:hypothetical protein Q4595_00415 [Wenyingzhuangia sp. 1_MG-2023]|nr:hypothetical protein [Wenyingzhuangia sp. 1_MG-2023]